MLYFKKLRSLAVTTTLSVLAATVSASSGTQVVEKLSRGLVAVKAGNGYFLSWRLFGTEQGTDIAFNVYKGSTRLNSTPITNATCYQDNSSGSGEYSVRAVIGGQEQAASTAEHVLSSNYLRIPLRNVSGYRAGDASCGDLDGDGQYELVVKEERSPRDNSQSGTTGEVKLTAYKLDGTLMWRIDLGVNIREGEHYTQFMVYDLDGDGSAEIACKTAPGTKDGTGSFLKTGPAASDNDNANYRNSGGYVLNGPEYFTIFSGKTGAELATINYKPPRGSVSSWGDNYGNRVDRFLACVAYLDGVNPSVVACRGYYTRTCLWALDWRNGKLTERWFFDSNASGNSRAVGQGNHNLSVGDVDGDGRQEIVYGACTIDDDGRFIGTSRVGHGDAAALSDIDPDRPGLEYWSCHESGRCADLRDPSKADGGVLWSKPGTGDVGRATAADITAAHKGMECWASTGVGLYNCKGQSISGSTGSMAFVIWWDGDLLREFLAGTKVTKFGGGTLLSTSGVSTINGSKAVPNLQADLFGDWREEVIFTTGSELRIYTTTIPTTHRLYTLMHDTHYRVSIAWQNVAYNQPPFTGFYLGDGMKLPQPKPDITYPGTVKIEARSTVPHNSGTKLVRDIQFSPSTLSFIINKHNKNVRIDLFSIDGQRVFSRKVNSTSGAVSVSLPKKSLHNGYYLLKITLDGVSELYRICVFN